MISFLSSRNSSSQQMQHKERGAESVGAVGNKRERHVTEPGRSGSRQVGFLEEVMAKPRAQSSRQGQRMGVDRGEGPEESMFGGLGAGCTGNPRKAYWPLYWESGMGSAKNFYPGRVSSAEEQICILEQWL